MKYKDYEITRHDDRNVSLFVHEKKVRGDGKGKIPKGAVKGEEYTSKRHLGYYQKPEQLYNRILDDMWIHGASMKSKQQIEAVLKIIAKARSDIMSLIGERQKEKEEEVWP